MTLHAHFVYDRYCFLKVRLNDEAMMEMKREDLLHKWKQQDNYVDYLENSMAMHSGNGTFLLQGYSI